VRHEDLAFKERSRRWKEKRRAPFSDTREDALFSQVRIHRMLNPPQAVPCSWHDGGPITLASNTAIRQAGDAHQI
jgi:hypothetical protein